MKRLSVLLIFVAIASATVSYVASPFAGDFTETFEEYSSGYNPSVSIFGGLGLITDGDGYTYYTGGWGLAGPAAQAHDGTMFFGHNTNKNSFPTISFPSGVSQFGGYFVHAEHSNIVFRFYSAAGLEGTLEHVFDLAAYNQGRTTWFGAASTALITRIEMVSYYGIMDSLVITVIPPAVCGNGIVETGEQCDSSSSCCQNCAFASSATTCRAAVNSCDIAETCTGASDACPADRLSNTASCFCARQNLAEGSLGYYCNNNGGYYQCMSGAWAALSSNMACPTGTQCGCNFGDECSCSGTRSPCLFPNTPGSPVQTC